jgi:hypothetical protein
VGTGASVIYEEAFALTYHVPGITYHDVENMPVWERRALFNLLIKQRKLEEQQVKEAQGDTPSGGGDLMRMPMPGEAYGKTDMEKLGPPQAVARYLKGEQMRQEAAREKK